jgi:hypothetical protein
MSEDKSLDLIGVGRVAKSIPASAWKRIVETACSTFEKLISPITETTSGIGRLVHAKFDRLSDAEKVAVAETTRCASERVETSGLPRNAVFNHLVLCKVLDHAEAQTEPSLRELWSNLLAREMTKGAVHPEIANVLARLTTNDALLLLEIAKEQKDFTLLKAVTLLASNISLFGIKFTKTSRKTTLHHVMLERLGLIKNIPDVGWRLTAFGSVFVRTVTPLVSK